MGKREDTLKAVRKIFKDANIGDLDGEEDVVTINHGGKVLAYRARKYQTAPEELTADRIATEIVRSFCHKIINDT